jgi:hypothetical protein
VQGLALVQVIRLGLFQKNLASALHESGREVVRVALWIHCAWRYHNLLVLWATSVLIPCKHEKGGIMSLVASRFLQLPISLSLLLGTALFAQAAGWSDDFNNGSITDGNPVTWGTNPLGFFPGNYDASSGDLQLSAPGGGNNNQLVAWVDSLTSESLYVRAQGVILPGPNPGEDGGNLALLARLDPNFITGYVMYLDSGGTLGLQVSLQGVLTDITPTVDLGDLNALSDVIMEFNLVGDQLSGFVWKPGDSKPATPQITGTDGTFGPGKAGLAYDEDDDNTTAVWRWAMAQDVPFVDALAGDYNGDGKVDAADYVVWRKDPSAHGGDPAGYDTWRTNFGRPAGAGAALGAGAGAAVPEPSGLIQLLAAIAGLAGVSAGRWRSILG